MNTIPRIFQTTENPVQSSALVNFQSTSKWAEFVAHISQFSETTIPEARETIRLLAEQESDPVTLAILSVGIGRCLIHEGDFIKGPKSFGYAFSLTNDTDTEARAFIIIEMVAFMAIIGQYDLALMLLERVPTLTGSEYLLNLANYYWAVLKTRTRNFEIIPALQKSLTYFESIQEFATVAYHYKNIGNAFRKSKDFKTAEKNYIDGLNLAVENNYRHIESAIYHDYGILYFHQGLHDQAITKMNLALERADSFYMKTITHGNIGLTLCQSQQWQEAAGYLQKSVNLATTYGHFFLLPSITYNLAQCHEHMSNADLAFYFYKKGYEAARELLDNHFTYSGYRKKVMERYMDLLSANSHMDQPENDQQPDLSFAIDKTLKEIRAIFQGGILDLIIKDSGTVAEAVAELKIGQRTFFDIRKRSKQFYSGEPHPYVSEFYLEHKSSDWKAINKKFEQQLLPYLYNHYGQSKKELSRVLEINYHYAVKLTKGIDKSVLRL